MRFSGNLQEILRKSPGNSQEISRKKSRDLSQEKISGIISGEDLENCTSVSTRSTAQGVGGLEGRFYTP